jgi:hypothetical protein
MRTTDITIAGFSFLTLCASICPMNMGMMPLNIMPMKHDNTHVMAQEINHGEHKDVACEHYSQEREVAALSSPTFKMQQCSGVQCAFVSLSSVRTTNGFVARLGASLSNTDPPPFSESLVGTVILRT